MSFNKEMRKLILLILVFSTLMLKAQTTMPVLVDTLFAKKNIKIGKNLILADTSYRKKNKVLSIDSITGKLILIEYPFAGQWRLQSGYLQPKDTTKSIRLPFYKNTPATCVGDYVGIGNNIAYLDVASIIAGPGTHFCDASIMPNVNRLLAIDNSTFTPDTTIVCSPPATYEVSVVFALPNICAGAYIESIDLRTKGTFDSTGSEPQLGTNLMVDNVPIYFNGQPIWADPQDNGTFDYAISDNTHRTTINSVIGTFFWEPGTDFHLDGLQITYHIRSDAGHVVLTTDASGILKFDTLPNFITLDQIPPHQDPANFANTDLSFTGNRIHNGNSNNLDINNLSNFGLQANNYSESLGSGTHTTNAGAYNVNVTDGSNNNNCYQYPQSSQIYLNDNTNAFSYQANRSSSNNYDNYGDISTGNTLTLGYSPYRNPGTYHFYVNSQNNSGMRERLFTQDTTVALEVTTAGTIGTTNWIKIQPESMQLRTKSNRNGSAINGQVLTLIDANTGECDWATGGGVSPISSINAGNGMVKENDSTLGLGFVTLTSSINIDGVSNDKSVGITGSNLSGGIGVYLYGITNNSVVGPAVSIMGNNIGTKEDINITANNGKLLIAGLPTDNTSTQLLGKDANGYATWVDKDDELRGVVWGLGQNYPLSTNGSNQSSRGGYFMLDFSGFGSGSSNNSLPDLTTVSHGYIVKIRRLDNNTSFTCTIDKTNITDLLEDIDNSLISSFQIQGNITNNYYEVMALKNGSGGYGGSTKWVVINKH